MQLRVHVEHRDGFAVLTPQGEVDLASGPELKAAIFDVLADGAVDIVTNLLEVSFLDSTGLGALISGRRRAQELAGSLSLVCTQQPVLKVLHVTGLDTVFTIHDTVDAATTRRVVAT